MEIIAKCGINCSKCPAYSATINNDEEAKIKLAAEWSKQFNFDMKPEMVNCYGCLDEDKPKLGYCQMCEIRKCAVSKKVDNCAHCQDYACKALSDFHQNAKEAAESLEKIRKEMA